VKLPNGTELHSVRLQDREQGGVPQPRHCKLCLLEQKDAQADVLKAFKAVKDSKEKLEPLATALPTGMSKSKKEERKLQLSVGKQDLQKAKKETQIEITKAYELIRNYSVGEARTQWDTITQEIHNKDPWIDVNGRAHNGLCMRTWTSFMEYIELHKLTIFSVGTVEMQRY